MPIFIAPDRWLFGAGFWFGQFYWRDRST